MKFTKNFNVNFLIKNILVPFAVLVGYFGSYAFLSRYFIPRGVNYYFSLDFARYGLILLAVGIGFVLAYSLIYKKVPGPFPITFERPSPGSFLLLFLPLAPIAQYLINNRQSLSWGDMFFVALFFVVFSSVYLLLVPTVLGFFSSKRMLTSAGLAFVFSILNMASLSRSFSWFSEGSLEIQVAYLAAVWLISWLLLGIKKTRDMALLIGIFFIATAAIPTQRDRINSDGTGLPERNVEAVSSIGSQIPPQSPNVYLLIYDAYAQGETMRAYGVDNSAQESFLEETGFVLYPGTYSVGPVTLHSMNAVFNLTSQEDGNLRRAPAGDGLVQNAFQSAGYQTVGFFPNDYIFRGIGSFYDTTIPARSFPPSVYMISSILMGEFRFNLFFDRYARDQYLDIKRDALVEAAESRTFWYSHSNYPNHSQNSGACLPDEPGLYQERLVEANNEMRQDIRTIIERDPQAIIIVAGDHGPYLTKNCHDLGEAYPLSEVDRLDIQDRYGVFLAIRWPSAEYAAYDDIQILPDVFPAVFAFLARDPSVLKLKIEPVTLLPEVVSGAVVDHGVIIGGKDDGEALFEQGQD